MNIRLLFACTSVLTLASAIAQTRNERILDLTKAKLPVEERTRAWGGVSGAATSAGIVRKIVPLEVKFSIPSGGSSFRYGEALVYEAEITNVTSKDIVIPWEPDWTKIEKGFEKPPPGYVFVSLSLTAESPKLGKLWLSGHGLSGSTLVPGSLVRLAPGQSVRIRAPGRWASSAKPLSEIIKDLPQSFEVRLRFNFHWGLHGDLEQDNISNSLAIELRP